VALAEAEATTVAAGVAAAVAGVAAIAALVEQTAQSVLQRGAAIAGVASNFLLDSAANHAAAGHFFLDRHAAAHGAGGLVRNFLLHADRVGFGLAFRDALVARHVAFFFMALALVGRHLALDRDAFANPLGASNGVLFPRRASNPVLDRLGPAAWGAAIVAAIAAAGIAAAATAGVQLGGNPVLQARATDNFLAFPVTFIDALAYDLGLGNALPGLLHHGAFFNARNAGADHLRDGLDFWNAMVHRYLASPLFLDGLAFVGGVGFLFALLAVHSPSSFILLGDPLLHADGAGLGCTGITTALGVIGSSGSSRCGNESTSQQGNANMLPNHDISFVATLADPGRFSRTHRWAGPDNLLRLNVF
jgi:hypothetical protein